MCCTYPKIIPFYVLHVPQNHSFLCAARIPKLFLSMRYTYLKIIPLFVLHVYQNLFFLCAARTPKSFLCKCCTYPKIFPLYVLHVPQNNFFLCAARTPKYFLSMYYAFGLLSAMPERFFRIFALFFQSSLPPCFTQRTEIPQSFFHS